MNLSTAGVTDMINGIRHVRQINKLRLKEKFENPHDLLTRILFRVPRVLFKLKRMLTLRGEGPDRFTIFNRFILLWELLLADGTELRYV